MAGVEMRFVLDDDAIERQLDGLLARGTNLREPLDDIGQDMVSVTTRAFEKSQSPQGAAWQPSAAARAEGRRTLIDRGLRGGLMGSFSYIVGPDSVVYGTNVVHAAIHQFGGSIEHAGRRGSADAGTGFGAQLAQSLVTFPARPFVGHSDADLRRWEATLRDHLVDAGGGAA